MKLKNCIEGQRVVVKKHPNHLETEFCSRFLGKQGVIKRVDSDNDVHVYFEDLDETDFGKPCQLRKVKGN